MRLPRSSTESRGECEGSGAGGVLAGAGLFDEPHEGQTAAIQDGNFQVVDFHEDVVDSHGVENTEEVLGGGDEDALAHQAGGVADARHVPPTAGIWKLSRSVRTKTIPVETGAGRMRMWTGAPLCRPTPLASTGRCTVVSKCGFKIDPKSNWEAQC